MFCLDLDVGIWRLVFVFRLGIFRGLCLFLLSGSLSCRILLLSMLVLSYRYRRHALSCLTLFLCSLFSCRVLPRLAPCRVVLSYLISPCLVLPCRVVPCLVLSYPVLSCLILQLPRPVLPCLIVPCHCLFVLLSCGVIVASCYSLYLSLIVVCCHCLLVLLSLSCLFSL